MTYPTHKKNRYRSGLDSGGAVMSRLPFTVAEEQQRCGVICGGGIEFWRRWRGNVMEKVRPKWWRDRKEEEQSRWRRDRMERA